VHNISILNLNTLNTLFQYTFQTARRT